MNGRLMSNGNIPCSLFPIVIERADGPGRAVIDELAFSYRLRYPAPDGIRHHPRRSTMTAYTPPLSTEDLRPWMIGRTVLVDLPGRRPATHPDSTPSTRSSGVIESYEVGADRATLVRTTDKRAFSLDDYLLTVEIPPANTQPWQPPADPDLSEVREAVLGEIQSVDEWPAERIRGLVLDSAAHTVMPLDAEPSLEDVQAHDRLILARAQTFVEWVYGPNIDAALAEADTDLAPVSSITEFGALLKAEGLLIPFVAVAQEILHARGKGYTPAHDEQHGPHHVLAEIQSRTAGLDANLPLHVFRDRMRVVAGLAVAGIVLADRWAAHVDPNLSIGAMSAPVPDPTRPGYNTHGKRMIRDEPQA
jgi:hypothetical protein